MRWQSDSAKRLFFHNHLVILYMDYQGCVVYLGTLNGERNRVRLAFHRLHNQTNELFLQLFCRISIAVVCNLPKVKVSVRPRYSAQRRCTIWIYLSTRIGIGATLRMWWHSHCGFDSHLGYEK